MHERLYDAAKRAVEFSSQPGDAGIVPAQEIEIVQAIILISTYESMRGFYDLAWTSASRAFRIVQLMRLHEVDGSAQDPFLDQHDLTEKEEFRRTFWMTYLLDSMFAVRGNWPVALRETMVSAASLISHCALSRCIFF